MRPHELRLRNFRSYFGPEVVFSFRDRRLVGIVGPIGSGKSSILDGIAYALYGKTPSVARSTKALINQRADDGAVALRFDVDGDLWEVVRSIRRRGQSQHALYRLADDEAEPEHLEKVVGEGDVNARVVALIGFEFDAFNRSVLLAQGRFAEFLRARRGERDDVLKGVFGHDRIDAMRSEAKEKARAAEADAERVAFQVQQLEEQASRLVEARTELVTWEQRLAALEKAEPQLATLDEQIQQNEAALVDAQRRRKTLDAIADGLPDSKTTETRIMALERALDGRAASAEALASAADLLQEATAKTSELDSAGERTRLDTAAQELALLAEAERTLAHAASALKKASDERADGTARLADAIAAADATDEAGKTAVAERHAAEEAAKIAAAGLHAAQHSDMAATLRQELASGGLCPVCAQKVSIIPAAKPGADLSAAEAAAQTARGVLESSREREAEGQRAASQAAATRSSLETEVTRLSDVSQVAEEQFTAATAQADEQRTAVRGLLGPGDDFAGILRNRRALLSEAAESETKARKRLDDVRAEHDQAVAVEQSARQGLSSIQVAVAQQAARLDLDLGAGTDTSPSEIREQVERLRTAWAAETQQLETAAAAAADTVAVAAASRKVLLAELEVTTTLGEAIGATRTRAEERRSEIAQIEAQLAASDELVEQRDRVVLRRDVMQRLVTDLTNSRFIRYLLDEEQAELAELGSEHLLRLTSGRYEFDRGGDFDIIDLTAADSVRKADSLSGGETFLASLGLALALAEMVARTGGRLESFFLDEGFGSLDPEHLDLAMEGIESLVASGTDRLVVVVSHVPELRHRIEDLIELDRSPTTGDTRVVRF